MLNWQSIGAEFVDLVADRSAISWNTNYCPDLALASERARGFAFPAQLVSEFQRVDNPVPTTVHRLATVATKKRPVRLGFRTGRL